MRIRPTGGFRRLFPWRWWRGRKVQRTTRPDQSAQQRPVKEQQARVKKEIPKRKGADEPDKGHFIDGQA